ncbi:RIP metalloprotease RseP [Hyalangium versicolor]|uniref:RIP metalloprotease RseP n=1 Tax=Hyalangium versicolor TaxID=2861190 RepID=UPI001CCD0C32|nr:RIP metalloprotease RseP [Hyalangium versicolor]
MASIGFFALLLGVLVTVHELGHFLVAKACGVKVLKFSFGFGPKLLSFTKGETEYQIALLPLGGFVKMAGDVAGEDLEPDEAHRGFLAQPPWKRMAIVLAGPAFNLVFPILIYFFIFWGPHEAISTRLGYVPPGTPAAAAGLRPGDRILAVEGDKVRTFDEMAEAFIGRFERPIPLTVERNGEQFIANVTPLKYVDSSPFETVERGRMMVEANPQVPIVGVPPGSEAAQAGLKTFDRIVAINGTPVPDEATLYQVLAKQEGLLKVTVQRLQPVEVGTATLKVPERVELQVPKQAGKEGLAALGVEPRDLYVAAVMADSPAAAAGIRSGDRLVAVNGEPLTTFHMLDVKVSGPGKGDFTLTWRGQDGEHTSKISLGAIKEMDELGNVTESKGHGLRPWLLTRGEVPPVEKVTVTLEWNDALKQAAKVVPKIISGTVGALAGLVTRDVPLSTISSPIGIAQLAARSTELGWDYFLNLMAVISINLGVVNLLPIPVLDGFAVLAALWESVRRRPIPVRVREVANVIGLAMLAVLMLVAFYNDISKWFFPNGIGR